MSETLIVVRNNIRFEMASPEGALASEEASMVVVPGADGEFGVLAGHAPLVSSLRPGVVSVYAPGGEIKKIFVSGGFADAGGSLCSIMAEEAIPVGEIDRERVVMELRALRENFSSAGDDAARKSSLARDIKVAEAKLAAAA